MSEEPLHIAILRAVDSAVCKAAEDIDSFDGETHWIGGNTGDIVPAASVAVLRTLANRFGHAHLGFGSANDILNGTADRVAAEAKLPRESEEDE